MQFVVAFVLLAGAGCTLDSDTDTAGPDGSYSTPYGSCVVSEPEMPATCDLSSLRGRRTTATEDDGARVLDIELDDDGLLAAVDGASCTHCLLNQDLVDSRCQQWAVCGDCLYTLWATSYEESGWAGPIVGCGPASHAEVSFSFDFTGACDPSCVDRSCGDDGCGGSCGSCPAGEICFAGSAHPSPSHCVGGSTYPGENACSECLAECAGTPGGSCCSGEGCLCETECLLTDCPTDQYFCCSAYGCICRDCPCSCTQCGGLFAPPGCE